MPRKLEEWQIEDYAHALWLHRILILLTTVLFGGFSAAYVAQKPSIYKAVTRVLIETSTPRFVEFQEAAVVSPWDRSFIQTEYQVISSRAVLSKVVEELHLSAFPPFSRSRDPVAALQGMLTVDPVRSTNLVDIRCVGVKPELITRIANSVADIYTRANLERRRETTSGGVQWLREEVSKMEEKMREAQIKLQEFREQHESFDFREESQNTVLQSIQGLNASLSKTREDRIEAETKYREKHPALQELLIKEKELQLALLEQEQRALEMSRLSIQYNTLLREAKTSEQIYNVLLTRLKELSVQEGLQSNNVHVVDRAQIPYRPIKPNRPLQTAIATFFGFLLGCGISILRESMVRTVRTRQDFERLLEIPFLGHLPLASDRHLFGRGEDTLLLSNNPHSVLGEMSRSIRTTLEFLLPGGQNHCLLLTSALPEEGKSLTCANLAIVFHELGRKVLLVDVDLRRPTLHRTFKLNLEPGLSACLQGAASPEEIIQPVPSMENLHVVTAGASPPQATDLLSSAVFRDLLKAWREEYTYILLDSPPVLVAADSAILATLVEGVLFLVRANRTHGEAAIAAKQRLVDVGGKMLGGILNGARLEMERGYRYYYSYRYSRGNRQGR